MKRSFLKFLALSVLPLLILACSVSIPERLDHFVDKAELDSESYDADDWKQSMEQYKKLVDEYSASEKKKEYTQAEKEMAARAMGRYHALLVRNGVEATAAYIEELKAIVPAYLEGLLDGLDENSEEIGKTLEGLFDTEELDQIFQNLEQKLENILGGEE